MSPSEVSKEEAPNYNATTDDALWPADSDWLCKYDVRTKQSIHNASCELFTEHFLPTNEITERTFFSQSMLITADYKPTTG
jgi:hypothetical protein